MFSSLRARLTLWYIGVLATVLIAFSGLSYWLLSRELNHRLDTELQRSIEGTARLLANEIAEGESDTVAAQSALAEQYFPQQSVAIFDGRGQLLTAKLTPGETLDELPVAISAVTNEVRFHTRELSRSRNDSDRRMALQRVAILPDRLVYLIVVSQSVEQVAAELGLIRKIFYFVVPLSLLLAGASGWFLARKSLSPVVAMSETARRISAQNLDQRLPIANRDDELGRLAATFNELLARLSAAFLQQRQFMADASHELRTPLYVIQTTTQVTLEQPHREESEYRDALSMIDEQTRRLTRIVEDMFTLARADAGRRELQKSTFYLDELLDEAGRAARVLAAGKGVEVGLATAGEAPFHGDEGLLRQMILNLLDNAIKHTPAGGQVSLKLLPQNQNYLITVADTGVGIPPADQPRIFERFYRADKARARARAESGHGGGVGLGLSIAQWIAQAHGGSLRLQKSDAHGSVFVISLPISNPEVLNQTNT